MPENEESNNSHSQAVVNNTEPKKKSNTVLVVVLAIVIGLVFMVVVCSLLYFIVRQSPDDSKLNTTKEYLPDKPNFEEDQAGATRRYSAMNSFLNTNFPANKKSGPEQLGNFYQTDWCLALQTPSKCSTYEPSVSNPGQSIEIYQLNYPSGDNFGYGYRTFYIAQAEAMGMKFSFGESGKTVVGSGLSMNYAIAKSGSSNSFDSYGGNSDVVALGSSLEYTTESGIKIVQVTDASSVIGELNRYLKSEQEFLTYSIKREDELLNKIETTVNNNEITKKGNCRPQSLNIIPKAQAAIPPKCDDIPLTDQEKSSELDRARTEINKHKEFINRHYKEMYALTADKIFWQKCPDCWR